MRATPWTANQRVSRSKPCPVCGSPDWCGFSSDGRFVFCHRSETWNGRPAIRQTDAGAMFALSDDDERPKREYEPGSAPTAARPPSLPREMLDSVYRELAARAGLREEAQYDIVTKRLFPAALETGVYFSLPRSGRQNQELSEALIERFGVEVMRRVPGFTVCCRACSGNGVRGKARCPTCEGLGELAPRFRSVRNGHDDYAVIACDENGLAFWAASRRLPFTPGGGSKYLLLSSSRSGEASVSGLPKYHVAGRAFPADPLWFTEGVIKAEILAWRHQVRVVGIYSTSVDQPTLERIVELSRAWQPCS